MSGTTSSSAGVNGVQVSLDNGTPQTASGTSSWTATIDTTTVPDGKHTITVQAAGANGATGTTSITINVDNSGTTTSCPATPPGTTELSGNLSLETSQSGWTGVYNTNTALARVQPAGGSYDGSWALQVAPKAGAGGAAGVNNASPLWVPGPPGQATTASQAYTGSAFVQTNAPGEEVTLLLQEISPSGSTVGSSSTTVDLADTAWYQVSTGYTAQATGDALHYTLYGSNFGNSFEHFRADCLSLQTP